tara:strand:+ start:1847 stop:2002 length:156 start_codon:yes stop_codon:yes gene_type:complete
MDRKKCVLVKLTRERGKIANKAMVKARRKSNQEKIKKDREKRLREYNAWFK